MTFFKRDVVILVLCSIFIGVLFARLVSQGANFYFQETLTSIVGNYGEYDLLIQLREENKAEAVAEVEQIIKEKLPGAKLKDGPLLAQKVNLFIALPEELKTRSLYENIDKLFAAVPGGAGVSIVTEPRINIRGIPAGAAPDIASRIQEMDGVKFIYRTGGSIGIVMADINKVTLVREQVELLLKENKMIEISFPSGLEPENPIAQAEKLVRMMKNQLGIDNIRYVSVDRSTDELAYTISTMQELRRFLAEYRTKLWITVDGDRELGRDDQLAVARKGNKAELADGEVVGGNIVVQIDSMLRDNIYQGSIIQGDSSELGGDAAYFIKDGRIDGKAGGVKWQNPREELLSAVQKAASFSKGMPELAQQSRLFRQVSIETLNEYQKNRQVLDDTVDHIEEAAGFIQDSSAKLSQLDVVAVRDQLDAAAAAMDRLAVNLKIIRFFNPGAAMTIGTIRDAQDKMAGFADLLDGVNNLERETMSAGVVMGKIQQDAEQAADLLNKLSQAANRQQLDKLDSKIQQFAGRDAEKAVEALSHLESAAPTLRDEEISASLKVMDKLISGQVIPDKRLQIMVPRGVEAEQVRPVIEAELGQIDAGIYETDLGLIEPNIYLQAYQILSEVRAVLAGLAAAAVVLVFLVLDHTIIVAGLRMEHNKCRLSLWQRMNSRENWYSTFMGSLLLSVIAYLAGGTLPYVPWFVMPLIGGLAGFIIGIFAERFNPLSETEIIAAESLGLSFDEIMREIIIPDSRPGLLQQLNRRWQKFK